jgi:5'-nucleotidase / UDP-sugar diphosphatase
LKKKYCYSTKDKKNYTLEIFYINDLHRKFGPLYSLRNNIKEFDNEKDDNVDKLKIAAGDLVVGSDEKLNSFFFKFFSKKDNQNNPFGLGFDAMCLGNHEFDVGEAGLARELDQDLSYPFVATNLTIKSGPLVNYTDNKENNKPKLLNPVL